MIRRALLTVTVLMRILSFSFYVSTGQSLIWVNDAIQAPLRVHTRYRLPLPSGSSPGPLHACQPRLLPLCAPGRLLIILNRTADGFGLLL